MFECAFTGRWPIYANPMVEDINPCLAAFWTWWVVLVNFALTRVVGALFLKATLAEASIDKDKQAMEALKDKHKTATIVRSLFREADTSGDGVIDREEFTTMLQNPDIERLLKQLDISPDEAEALFSVLSADDGYIDYGEFLTAALKMKSSAKTMDAIQLQASVYKISDKLATMSEKLTSEVKTSRQLLLMLQDSICNSKDTSGPPVIIRTATDTGVSMDPLASRNLLASRNFSGEAVAAYSEGVASIRSATAMPVNDAQSVEAV